MIDSYYLLSIFRSLTASAHRVLFPALVLRHARHHRFILYLALSFGTLPVSLLFQFLILSCLMISFDHTFFAFSSCDILQEYEIKVMVYTIALLMSQMPKSTYKGEK